MATETPPSATPPSATGGAKPISEAELQREVNMPPMKLRMPDGEPPPVNFNPQPKAKQEFREENAANVTMGDDKGNREVEPTLPGFLDAAKKKLEQKVAAAEVGESTDAPPEEKPKKKVEKAPEKPAAEKAPEAKAADEVPEEQRRVLPHDKPDTAKRIKYFLGELKTRDEKIAAAEAKLKELESRPATPANDEAIKAAQEKLEKYETELTRFRRRYDLDNDPEFKTKYREPVEKVESAIETTFKKYGLSDATLKVIKDEGGFAAFSNSGRVFPLQEADPENPGKTKTVYRTASELTHSWLASMNLADAEEVKASIGKQQLLKMEEKAATEKALAESKAYFESQGAAQKQAAEAQQAAAKKATDEYAAWLAKTEGETEWLKDVPIPDDAAPEQKKQIQDRNEFAKQLRTSLQKHPTNAQEYGQLKFDAAEAHHLRRTLGEKEARIQQLEEQVKKAKGAMRTTPKAGSILNGGNSKPPGSDEPLKDPTDFASAFKRAAERKLAGVEE